MGNLFYCYTTEQNYHSLTTRKEELNFAKMRQDTIFYDYNKNKFCDDLGYPININGKRILLRGCPEELEKMISTIIENGGIPLNSLEDIEKIKKWQNYIQTERKAFITTGKEILSSELIRQKIKLLANEEGLFFFKTIEKDFSGPIGIEELENSEYGLLPALEFHKEDLFSVSEIVKIEQDDFKNIEYRCFIVEGKIITISRTLVSTYHSIPFEATRAANFLLDKIKRQEFFPQTFALDFMLCEVPRSKTLIYDITEINPLEASGEYIYNTIYKESIFKMRQEENKLKIQSDTQTDYEMRRRLPVYKHNRQYAFTYNEPNKIFHQSYTSDGFSFKYGSAKKFGNPLQAKFYNHFYYGMGGGTSVSTEEILNGNIPVNYLLKPHVLKNLKKALDIDFDAEKIKRGIELEEEQKRMRSRIKKEIEKNK